MKKNIFYAFLIINFLINACAKKNGETVVTLNSTAEPPGGTFREDELPVLVTLKSNLPATIYYSTDGSSPIPGRDNTFSGPSPVTNIQINGDTVLRFFAETEDGTRESVKTETYTIDKEPYTEATPPGGRFADSLTVTISANEPATIYYTAGPSPPDPATDAYDGTCSNSCQINVVCAQTEDECKEIIKFFAVDETGIEESTIHSETYIVDRKAPTTTASQDSGQYDSPINVQLFTDEPATIYYCTNGGTPSTQSEFFIENGGCTYRAENSASIDISDHTILKFFAVDEVGNQEALQTKIYRIGNSPMAILEPGPGLYNSLPFVVSVTSIPQPATFYYTLDGTDVQIGSSPSCDTPCTFTITTDESTVVKYIITDGVNNDKQRQALYIIDITPPTTTTDPSGGYYDEPISVNINANEQNVTVYYTFEEDDTSCSASENQLSFSSGSSPIKNINITKDGALYYYGVDIAENKENMKCETYTIYGRYTEDFNDDTYIDTQNTTANIDYVNSKATLPIDEPQILKTLDLTTTLQDLVISGNYLLGAGGAQGILVFDISTPDDPVLLDNFIPPLSARNYTALSIYGRYLIAGGFSPGNIAIDLFDVPNPGILVSNPPSPVTTYFNSLDTGERASKIEVLNNHVLVAMGDPQSGTFLGSSLISLLTDFSSSLSYEDQVNTSNYKFYDSFVIQGDYLFGGSVDGYVESVNISDLSNFPTAPSSSVSLEGPVYDIALLRDYLLVLVDAGSTARLKVIDASDPNNLQKLSYTSEFSAGNPYKIKINGTTAYITSSSSLVVYDVSYPSSPTKLIEKGNLACTDLEIFENYAYCARTNGQLVTLKIADRVTLSEVYKKELTSTIKRVRNTERGILAIKSDGVSLFSKNNLAEIFSIPLTDAEDAVNAGFSPDGKRITLIATSTGLDLYNTGSTSPSLITNPVSGNISALDLDRDILYTAENASGCKIYNVESMTNPYHLYTAQRSGESCLYIDHTGPEVFLLYNASGVDIIGAEDPSNPSSYGNYNTAGNPATLSLFGNILAIADGLGGVPFVDFQSRSAPSLLSSLSSTDARDINLKWQTAYLADSSGGLKSINLQLPDTPVVDRTFSAQDAETVDFDGEYIYLGAGSNLYKINTLKPLTSYKGPAEIFSTNINTSGLNVKRARIQYSGEVPEGTSVSFFLSNDGGASWIPVYPGQFIDFPGANSDLMWKAELTSTNPRSSPTLRSVTIIYYYE